MATHGEREHAQWSASATERNWTCPGALALTDGLPDTTSEAADWGTCCHQIAERCLRGNLTADAFIGETEKGKRHSFVVDDEMAETAHTYVDYVIEQFAAAGVDATLQIEQRFSLAALNPPFEAGGTADAVIYSPANRTLQVIDLKGGRGVVVDAAGNKQARTYALGALLANSGAAVDRVITTIVQPRAPHKDGIVRSETIDTADLLFWTIDLFEAMKRSAEAIEMRPALADAVWADRYLKPGACTFCKAAGACPALRQKAYDAAGVWFDDLDQPCVANTPDALSPEAMAQALDAADLIGAWINSVRALAHAQAESGVQIPNYQLVQSIGRRRWIGEEADVAARLSKLGVDPFAKKLVSPAGAEKLLGAKRKGEIASLCEKPVTGTNLVRIDKTTRDPVKARVDQFFTTLD